jgi:hypothetical protein
MPLSARGTAAVLASSSHLDRIGLVKVHDDNGQQIDAEFEFEVHATGCDIVFASGGGGRNLKYGRGLEAVLGRLLNVGASIEEVLVASSDTEDLSESERRVRLPGVPYPVEMASGVDVRELRLSIGRVVAKIGRAPDAKGSGNREKKLVFRLSSNPALSEQHLAFGRASQDGEQIPSGLTKDHLLRAIESLRKGIPHDFGPSVKYDVLHEEERFAPKAVVGLAAQDYDGSPRGPQSFHAGLESRCFRTLEKHGFTIVPKLDVDGPKRPATWALLCNPLTFDIEAASEELDRGTWDLPLGNPSPGDRLIFWKAKGTDGQRGIVALGEVIDAPAERSPDSASGRYWKKTRQPTSERRIVVRYLRPPHGPLWENAETSDLLSRLSVSRGQGNKLYDVAPTVWRDVLNAMGGWPSGLSIEEATTRAAEGSAEQAEARKAGGQGWSSSPEHRRVVELHAMAAAQEYLEVRGYACTDTSASRPYDLVARRGNERLFVEVKGTTTAGEQVFLTKNEVAHARANPGSCALFILHGITLRETAKGLVGCGGEQRVFTNWMPDDHALQALTFRYSVPT